MYSHNLVAHDTVNKLGKFVDAHTIEATDKKGVTSTITSSRFLIATGGRPSPLACEGGELAISSDDVFSIEKGPGKTLCVGASYISLECAGFLAGLGYDVTVAVRSILLRGFDRECSEKVGKHMEETGMKFRTKVVPQKLTKTSSGQIEVEFSDGTTDTFDTVLSAIGRTADTEKLGLEALGVKMNPKNRRIIGKNEQTDCPNIYVVGDVLDVRATAITRLQPTLTFSSTCREHQSSLQLRFRLESCWRNVSLARELKLWTTKMSVRRFSLQWNMPVWASRKTTRRRSTENRTSKSTIANFFRWNGPWRYPVDSTLVSPR